MHFRWLNNKTVQCNISREEVDQLGYSIEDLLVNQEASKGFVSKIVELAKKSINYERTSTNMCSQVI